MLYCCTWKFSNTSNYSYDARGRLTQISQGSDAEERSSIFSYNSEGFLEKATDPLGRIEEFFYDQAGRVIRRTLTDGRIIRFTYDANGNLTSIIPPGREAHIFGYTPINLTERYIPASASGITNSTTRYEYNLDKQPTNIIKPDGQTVTFVYDPSGRLNTIITPDQTVTHTYETTGQLKTLNTSQGINLTYTYDGFLPLSETWNGLIHGSVNRSYNNYFTINLALGEVSFIIFY